MAFLTPSPVLGRILCVLPSAALSRTCTHRPHACASVPRPISSPSTATFLTTAVAITGSVERGLGRGSAGLGFATANLPGGLVPPALSDGVYLGFGHVPSVTPSAVPLVANLGTSATFGDVTERVLEAHLMCGSLRDFYGEEMRVCLVGRLRDEMKFGSVAELVANIRNDVAVADEVLQGGDARSVGADFLAANGV